MPHRDPVVRQSYMKAYAKQWRERKQVDRPDGVCSRYPNCVRLVTGTNKKCDHCLAYMREYKKKYREQEGPAGSCSYFPDCKNYAAPGIKLCQRCNEQRLAYQKAHRPELNAHNQLIQEEVLKAYGGVCTCCGELSIEFLSIDHIGGYVGTGPRKGSALYRWLKHYNFPVGFRILCMNCNFCLGHHGYCPHSDLTQPCTAGRPTSRIVSDVERSRRRTYWINYKLEVMSHYGGAKCACCDEDHHEFLQFDHIDGNGAEHRRNLTGNARDGRNLAFWLRKNGYPPGFRVLCTNCNFALGHFGSCPHQRIS